MGHNYYLLKIKYIKQFIKKEQKKETEEKDTEIDDDDYFSLQEMNENNEFEVIHVGRSTNQTFIWNIYPDELKTKLSENIGTDEQYIILSENWTPEDPNCINPSEMYDGISFETFMNYHSDQYFDLEYAGKGVKFF